MAATPPMRIHGRSVGQSISATAVASKVRAAGAINHEMVTVAIMAVTVNEAMVSARPWVKSMTRIQQTASCPTG